MCYSQKDKIYISSGKMKEIIPSDVKEVLKAIVGFRTSLEAVESHIYVTIPVVYKVVRWLNRPGEMECQSRKQPRNVISIPHPFRVKVCQPNRKTRRGIFPPQKLRLRQTITKPSNLHGACSIAVVP